MTSSKPSEQQDFEALLRYLKVLADQSRLRMLGFLANGERSVEELAALLDLRAATVSHHLGLLKDLDLVSMRAEGNTHIYRLNGKALGRMNKLLNTPENLTIIERGEGDAWERKVLRDFFDGDRLKGIPSYRKKRLVILKWLAEQFARGRTYSEAEVNELIKHYHPDTATLRRDLIGFGFMQREHGTYWRLQAPVEAESAGER
jgi:predicted transcriptional regulator